jgi:hypothetical protein
MRPHPDLASQQNLLALMPADIRAADRGGVNAALRAPRPSADDRWPFIMFFDVFLPLGKGLPMRTVAK